MCQVLWNTSLYKFCLLWTCSQFPFEHHAVGVTSAEITIKWTQRQLRSENVIISNLTMNFHHTLFTQHVQNMFPLLWDIYFRFFLCSVVQIRISILFYVSWKVFFWFDISPTGELHDRFHINREKTKKRDFKNRLFKLKCVSLIVKPITVPTTHIKFKGASY